MRYKVRRFEIDEDAFLICCDGAPLKVEPRVFDLIIYLIRHRNRVVEKSELVNHVWQGCKVSDSSIHRCVSVARSTLRGEHAIKTIPVRGYQWIANTSPAGLLPDVAVH